MLVVVVVVVVVVGLFAVVIAVVMVLSVVLEVAVELEVLLEGSVVGQFDSSLPSEQSLCPLHTQVTSMHFSLLKQRNSESVQVTAMKTKKFNSGSVMMVECMFQRKCNIKLTRCWRCITRLFITHIPTVIVTITDPRTGNTAKAIGAEKFCIAAG